MQRYLMNFSTDKMQKIFSEVMVVGSGVAGLRAALQLAHGGREVLLTVRDTLLDSNTNKAQGGIAAALGEDDTAELHLKDTLIAGAGLSSPEVSRIVVTEGREEVKGLSRHGAKFDHDADGHLLLGREGCHSRYRIVHANGDATGAEVARSLLALVEKEEKIHVMTHCYVVDLLTEGDRVVGALALWKGEKICLMVPQVVLATGGVGRIFRETTNPMGATGSGLAMALRAGAEMMDMEFVQFHPTALAIPHCPNFLISEAVRGAGGILRNAEGRRFMPEYHELAELAPRDVVARCIFREMQRTKKSFVFLDTGKISDVTKKFPMIAKKCREFGIDIEKEWIPVAPAAHYMMGGIRTDIFGRTNLKGLYACGEAACTGLQGANRLASNSLLEGLVFGKRTAEAILLEDAPVAGAGSASFDGLRKEDFAYEERLSSLQDAMSRRLGICREEKSMHALLSQLRQEENSLCGIEADSVEALDYRARLEVSGLMVHAALRRKESRGAHYRKDYPKTSVELKKHFTDCLVNGELTEGVWEESEDGYDIWSGRKDKGMA